MAGAIGVAQEAEEHVEDKNRARIADVGTIVDRRAANIKTQVMGIDRRKIHLAPMERVIESQDHPDPSVPSAVSAELTPIRPRNPPA